MKMRLGSQGKRWWLYIVPAPKHHSITTYRWSGGKFMPYAFLTSALEWRQWVYLSLRPLNFPIHCIWGWVGPTDSWDQAVQRKIPTTLETCAYSPQSVVRPADWTISVPRATISDYKIAVLNCSFGLCPSSRCHNTKSLGNWFYFRHQVKSRKKTWAVGPPDPS
jgi:hypothetical protein